MDIYNLISLHLPFQKNEKVNAKGLIYNKYIGGEKCRFSTNYIRYCLIVGQHRKRITFLFF